MIRSLTALGFAALTLAASAQEAVHYREGQEVDPLEVARILGAQPPLRLRSIRLLDDESAPQASPASLSLPVRFAFDSADILPNALPQLDALAAGIKLLPEEQKVTVEGHTDATGSDEYNLRLSQRRAQAVKTYLVRAHAIDPRRLVDTGYGELRPIEGSDPYAAHNRRVQFRGG